MQDCLQLSPPPKQCRQLGVPQRWRVMFGFEQLMTGCQTASLHWGPFTKVHSCNALSVVLVIHPEKDRGSFFLTHLVLSELKLCEFHCTAHYHVSKSRAAGAGSKKGEVTGVTVRVRVCACMCVKRT